MYKVALNFSRLTIPQKSEKAGTIITKMTNNPNYPNPVPTLAEVRAAADALSLAYQAASDGGKSLKVSMHEREDELSNSIVLLGSYVQSASSGDKEKILSSGFDVRKERTVSNEEMDVPENVSCKGGRDGEVKVSWDGVDKAKTYVVEMSSDNGATWTSQGTPTKSKETVKGLTSGTIYWFRVAAIGSNGQSDWSAGVQGKAA